MFSYKTYSSSSRPSSSSSSSSSCSSSSTISSNSLDSNGTQYDIVFAGGGTTACVVAGRLAEADPTLKILIIEAGSHTRDLPVHVQPARYFHNLVSGNALSMHKGVVSDALGGRAPVVPSGCCVGGGSSVNFAMYTRASASDYDDWEKLENPGWGSKDLIPLARKVETFQVEEGSPRTHGTEGPIKVSHGGCDTNIGREFLQAGTTWDKGRTSGSDTNDFRTINQYTPWYKYIDRNTGKRSDAAHHFIYNKEPSQSRNLHVLTDQRVVRVIFENRRAVGVEFISAEKNPQDKSLSEAQVVRAARLVVVSGGAFGSPAILERSGIGAKQHLAQANVEQTVDLPGVGENYQDHNLVIVPYLAADTSDSLEDVFSGDEKKIAPHLAQWTENGSGLLAHNSIDAGVKMRPSQEDLKELGPSFKNAWKGYFANAPDKPVTLICSLAAHMGAPPETYSKIFSIAAVSMYPLAIGYTHISSGTDPRAPLKFDPRFFENYADVAVMRWSYKHGRELARRMKSYRGELASGHPNFPESSAAAVVHNSSGPASASTPVIAYTPADDDAIDNYLRAKVSTTWHSLGTCAMKPRAAGGVVDSRLNVYGVYNLKVADLSICPANVAANTYNTALLVGEKAFLIIAEELGLRKVC
ncbi:alcohol oxidase [Gymnopus androsaceus JB14]|uniref:Alcohol oxidase n=1 Tax=Gymnopus androsaceus JB14 TaxID=1447944 RepID=A0A6A4HJG3_9AGAR|nr:alcohol oxidase [Gymnopus androsaceus JB14]